MAEQNLVRRECDHCGEKMDFKQNRQVDEVSPEEAARVSSWVTLVKVHFIKQRNQVYPVTKHGCRASCAENIIKLGMLELPKEVVAQLEQERLQMEAAQKKIAEAIARGENPGPVAVQTPGEA